MDATSSYPDDGSCAALLLPNAQRCLVENLPGLGKLGDRLFGWKSVPEKNNKNIEYIHIYCDFNII